MCHHGFGGLITFCQKCKIKPQMSGASWWRGMRKMELRKSRRCEGATTGKQTHTFEHLAVKKTPSMVFVAGRHTCGAAEPRRAACASAPRQSRSHPHAPCLMRQLDRRISVNWSMYRPRPRTLTSGKRKYTPGRPWRLRRKCGEETRLP